ncbi:mRNA-decapping enzyme-like protein isoform X1 [Papaver somniferum]|uniref:mRNA-decapping enzyme-like protein isoform X1 n=1 Tax=Papaver somniferum TaxID=3469 RepID=UPI000E6F6B84|nr:mRNA-decapping enzyme-like protein isoform X1 [Papaver somniferum]
MTQGGKLLPNLDQQSTKLLNLTVLQRIDPYVEEILITAAHVTFYKFNVELSRWSRKDVEGSPFVVKRNAQPRFQFIVMNRRSTENLVEDLLGEFEYEVQVPYLLYRNLAQEVNGIWFYNSRECEDVANLFGRIFNACSKVPQKPKISSIKSEFEELEAVPTMAVMEGPLEPSSTAGTTVTNVPDDSPFFNFFHVALNLGNASSTAAHGRPDQSLPSSLSSSNEPISAPSPPPAQQLPSPVLPASSAPLLPILDSLESSSRNNSNNSRLTNLVKPITFFTPSPYSSPLMIPTTSLCIPTAPSLPPPPPPLHPPVGPQRPYGTPMLQPFPPPNPPPSLTPASGPGPTYRPEFTREKVHDALLRVIQKDQFIDMFYQELLNMRNT